MTGILYFIVIFLSTTVGAVVGVGGGIIIKPILDALNFHDPGTVGFLSSTSVLLMACISTWRQAKGGVKIDVQKALVIALGAVTGGITGSRVLSWVTLLLGNDAVLKSLQAFFLLALLIFGFISMNTRMKTFRIQSKIADLCIGFGLGLVSSFLGVGGGPFNIAFLMLFFSLDIKQCTVYSIIIILFSQASGLITLYATNRFVPYDLRLLLFTLPAAALGGFAGVRMNKLLSGDKIKRVLNCFIAVVVAINLYNLFSIIWMK